MTKYYEVTIKPHYAGFGMWQASTEKPGDDNLWDDVNDLLSECTSNVGPLYELGVDDLPDGLEDIRGSIYNEPDRVFGYFVRDSQGESEGYYFGIREVTEAEPRDGTRNRNTKRSTTMKPTVSTPLGIRPVQGAIEIEIGANNTVRKTANTWAAAAVDYVWPVNTEVTP